MEGLKLIEKLLVEVGRERRLYHRYIGEARAQRKKVLREWSNFHQDETLNSQNEVSGVGGIDKSGHTEFQGLRP